MVVVGILASFARDACAQDPAEKKPTPSTAEESATEYVIDIPRLPLELALKEFCRQTGLLYGYFPESPNEASFTTRTRVHGKLTANQALTRLLEGSGLTFDWTMPNQFSVQPRALPKIPKNGVGADTTRRSASDQMHARMNERPLVEDVTVGGRSGSTSQGPEEEVMVTGTRLRPAKGIDIEGPIPMMVFDQDEIKRSGASNVGDLIRNMPQQPYTRPDGFQLSGAQYAELRGIGFDTTAIQINGRRLVPSASSLTNNAFDLNTIPLVAVKDIQVLPDSASAVYGADAIGGVVNLILWDEIEEPVLQLNYGSARGGGAERRASFNGGYSNDKFKSVLVLDYSERDALLGAERDLWRDQDFRRFDSIDQRFLYTNPGNITGILEGPLPGLSSRTAAVPIGSTGIGLTPADFLATQATQNRESLFKYLTIVPEIERGSAFASAELKIEPGLKAFGELLYVDRSAAYQSVPPAIVGAIVSPANPFNPFHVPVAASFLLRDLGPRESRTDSDLLRGVVGMRGDLRSMTWDVSVLGTDEDSAVVTTNNLDPRRLAAALSSDNAATALNVFQDGPGGSPELISSLVTSLQSKYSSASTQVQAYVSGPLLDLPMGTLDGVAGVEWRRESVSFDEQQIMSRSFGSYHRLINAVFAEARMPLVSPDAGRPMLNSLTLTAAARLDDYSDFGDTFNPRYGLVWHPIEKLGVRASYGTSFRPPSMLELFTPGATLALLAFDPLRNNETTLVQVKTGGSDKLKPVKADSLTAGLFFKQPVLCDLELSATYWQIHMRDRITVIPPSLLLQNEALFPDRVVRNAQTPADIEAELPGTLASLDISRVNFGRLQTSGIDFAATMMIDGGRYGLFVPRLRGTWIRDFTTEDLPATPAVRRVGVASSFGTIARWRVVGSLSWEYGGVTLSSTARYVPSYADVAQGFGGANGRTIPSQTIVDAQASFDLGRLFGAGWTGLNLAMGANNLLDEAPSFAEVSGPWGFDESQGDLKQRYGYFVLSKKF